MDLIAKLPCVAAKIYRNLYREGSSIGAIDPNLDWEVSPLPYHPDAIWRRYGSSPPTE